MRWRCGSCPTGVVWQCRLLDYDLTPLARATGSRACSRTIFALMAFAGGLFALAPARAASSCPRHSVYAGSAIGVTLAGDLVTVFVYWELMAIGSTLVIWSAGTRLAYAREPALR